MMQVGRNLTDPLDGFLRGNRLLILDRDQKFTREFLDWLEAQLVAAGRIVYIQMP